MTDTQTSAAWRCFHCGDVFTDERCARLHFGRDEDSIPACQIKAGAEQGLLGALRDAEYAAADARQAIADESTDAARAYYAQATRHAQALRNAEEAGYDKGLADGRALSTTPAKPDKTARGVDRVFIQKLKGHAADLRREEWDEDNEAASLIDRAIAMLSTAPHPERTTDEKGERA